MNTVVQLRPRTLAHVLLDIQVAQKAFDQSWRIGSDTDIEAECLDRLDALQDEARGMVEAATGVTWIAIAGASL
jgi:hypothetical protein